MSWCGLRRIRGLKPSDILLTHDCSCFAHLKLCSNSYLVLDACRYCPWCMIWHFRHMPRRVVECNQQHLGSVHSACHGSPQIWSPCKGLCKYAEVLAATCYCHSALSYITKPTVTNTVCNTMAMCAVQGYPFLSKLCFINRTGIKDLILAEIQHCLKPVNGDAKVLRLAVCKLHQPLMACSDCVAESTSWGQEESCILTLMLSQSWKTYNSRWQILCNNVLQHIWDGIPANVNTLILLYSTHDVTSAWHSQDH